MTRNVSSSRKGFAALVILLLVLTLSLRAGFGVPVLRDIPIAALTALALLISLGELAVLLALAIFVLDYQPAPSYALALMCFLILVIWATGRVSRIKPRVFAPVAAAGTILIFYAVLGLDLFTVSPFLPIGSALAGAVLASLVLEIWNLLGLPLQSNTFNKF